MTIVAAWARAFLSARVKLLRNPNCFRGIRSSVLPRSKGLSRADRYLNDRLCHHAGDFAAISTRLLKAAEHWFSEVEEFVGPVSWAELPMQAPS
jgi:hypothetical protein